MKSRFEYHLTDPAIDQHSAAVKKCEGSIRTGIRVCRAQSVVSGSTLRIGSRHFSQSVFLHVKWPARNLSIYRHSSRRATPAFPSRRATPAFLPFVLPLPSLPFVLPLRWSLVRSKKRIVSPSVVGVQEELENQLMRPRWNRSIRLAQCETRPLKKYPWPTCIAMRNTTPTRLGDRRSVLLRARLGRSLVGRCIWRTALICRRKWTIFLPIVPCMRQACWPFFAIHWWQEYIKHILGTLVNADWLLRELQRRWVKEWAIFGED